MKFVLTFLLFLYYSALANTNNNQIFDNSIIEFSPLSIDIGIINNGEINIGGISFISSKKIGIGIGITGYKEHFINQARTLNTIAIPTIIFNKQVTKTNGFFRLFLQATPLYSISDIEKEISLHKNLVYSNTGIEIISYTSLLNAMAFSLKGGIMGFIQDKKLTQQKIYANISLSILNSVSHNEKSSSIFNNLFFKQNISIVKYVNNDSSFINANNIFPDFEIGAKISTKNSLSINIPINYYDNKKIKLEKYILNFNRLFYTKKNIKLHWSLGAIAFKINNATYNNKNYSSFIFPGILVASGAEYNILNFKKSSFSIGLNGKFQYLKTKKGLNFHNNNFFYNQENLNLSNYGINLNLGVTY